ncbi:MAG: hypothetical protein JXA28_05335 [Bacteroidetes bacterium]|nr:hypothetical protein [Bacteroidota bacterium]
MFRITLSAVILLVAPAFLTRAQEAVRIVYPPERNIIVGSATARLAGTFDPSVVSRVEVLEPLVRTEQVYLRTGDERDGFALRMKDLIGDDVIVERLDAVMILERNRKQMQESLAFPVSEMVDLRKFWESPQFTAFYQKVLGSKLRLVKLRLQGFRARSIDVQDPAYVERFSTTFASQFVLRPGMNSVHLWMVDRSGAARFVDSMRLFYQMEIEPEGPPDEFEKIPFHTAEREAECASCHTLPLPVETVAEQATVEDACSPCHSAMVELRSVHFPVQGWECLTCHNGAEGEGFAVYEDLELNATYCMDCHVTIAERAMEKPVTHFPAQDNCLTCHDVHGSTNRFLVARNVREICAFCHPDAAVTPHPTGNHPLEGGVNPADPERAFSCASCHDPHGADMPKLVFDTRMKMCKSCHNI